MVDFENSTVNTPVPVAGVVRPPLPRWTVPAVAVAVLAVTAVASVLLWTWVNGLQLPQDKRATAVLEVFKLAASVAVGGGGLFALYLAARRQRTQELELAQREKFQAHAEKVAETSRVHAERVAEATERDATVRRVTDLFTKSVDQLGSDKAAVRLGGMYALERLAQDNAEQRPTVVSVFCAYLRMPFEAPGAPLQPEDAEYKTALVEYREQVQEREVRVAAQRLLRDHLRKGSWEQPLVTYWADTDLDLTGAHLIDFDLSRCAIRTTRFDWAAFTGPAYFGSAAFMGFAGFGSATFTGLADFSSTTFIDFIDFGSATFTGDAYFGSAMFTINAYFKSATFTSDADFKSATLTSDTDFESATFDRGIPPEVMGFVPPTE
ncbi:pentapeptide repeat-containing protein [Umezawaea sp. Da 62-37]|uniref:pentapeptide repeat-containing protein n=1 Tax=Umezawaea sp. Da 62-37 TaxID=3075927 RepID=UPI0028F6DDAA|nr:pentapeptide repeat-containing protein [Umezawaea sp. Da 62-37]WNV86703.1 pentapeptide repeat-containing protein [Umezawaea sp. Da 62-37]WNV86714.1 pentapeptide repeat-containing protein [Umezawaea sp. Da 62-37]